MTKYKNKTYPLRIDNILQEKIKYIADLNDRPVSKQYERIIREYIERYEQEKGEIIIDTRGTDIWYKVFLPDNPLPDTEHNRL